MQYTKIFSAVKIQKFTRKIVIFFIFLLKTYMGLTETVLTSTHYVIRGGSNEYPLCMFWLKNKKIRYTPANPSFTIEKWGLRGYSLHGHAFLMYILLNSYRPDGLFYGT